MAVLGQERHPRTPRDPQQPRVRTSKQYPVTRVRVVTDPVRGKKQGHGVYDTRGTYGQLPRLPEGNPALPPYSLKIDPNTETLSK